MSSAMENTEIYSNKRVITLLPKAEHFPLSRGGYIKLFLRFFPLATGLCPETTGITILLFVMNNDFLSKEYDNIYVKYI